MDFDLRQLEIFCKVVELGSFSKAAEAVFLAQASVSERIANLENTVGTRLLDRLGRQVVPTRAGQLLYGHALKLLELRDHVRLEMEAFLGLRQGEVRIGASTIPGEYILPEVLGRLNAEHPGVSVSLTIGDSADIETRVLEGSLELGVIGSRSTLRSLAQQELWQDELVLAVPAGHPWAGRKAIALEELYQEPFILRELGSGTLKILENRLRESRSIKAGALKVVARFGTSTAVKEGIKAGLGVSILSRRALGTEIRAGILKTLRVKDLPMFRSFYLIHDQRRAASPLCRLVADFLASAAAEEKGHRKFQPNKLDLSEIPV